MICPLRIIYIVLVASIMIMWLSRTRLPFWFKKKRMEFNMIFFYYIDEIEDHESMKNGIENDDSYVKDTAIDSVDLEIEESGGDKSINVRRLTGF